MGKCQPLYCICGCRVPQRIAAVLLCSLGAIISYGQRANMNVVITRLVSSEIRNLSRGCTKNLTKEDPIHGGTENWSEFTQGIILGSFFIGYLVGQIPSGIMADKWGPRWMYSTGGVVSSIISLFSPLIIQYFHWAFVVASRILTGIAQATIFPCISILISRWVPFEERSTLGSLTYSSVSIGVILGNLISGAIMYYMNNWPNVFYFWGMAGLLWNIIFLIYVYSDYETHPHLPEREKRFLTERIAKLTRLKTPYKKIITDRGVIALVVGQLGHSMTLFFCTTNMPKYFSDVLHMSVRDVSIASSLPFVGMWSCGVITGKICDYVAKHTNISLRWNRGITTYLSFAMTNTFIVLMTYAGCHIPLAIISYSIGVAFIGTFCAGHKVNQMDITVNFNGFVMSLINAGASCTGFVTPILISWIANKNELWQWRIVSWVIFLVGGITTTYYSLMLQVHRAEWDVAEDEKEEWTKQRDARVAETERAKEKKQSAKAERKAAKGQATKSL